MNFLFVDIMKKSTSFQKEIMDFQIAKQYAVIDNMLLELI